MYIVLQFGSIWAIYDGDAATSRLLEKIEVDGLVSQFRNIIGKGTLNVFQFQKINPSRLMKMPATGYVIVRVGDMWTIYEGGKLTPQILEKANVAQITAIFPRLIDQQMLNAIAIDTFSPAKLLNLTPLPAAAASPASQAALTTGPERDRTASTGYKSSG